MAAGNGGGCISIPPVSPGCCRRRPGRPTAADVGGDDAEGCGPVSLSSSKYREYASSSPSACTPKQRCDRPGRGTSGRERAQPNSLPPSLIQGFVALLNTAAQIICSCSQGGGVVGGWGQAGLVSHSLGSGEPARSCQTCGPVNVTGLRLRRLPGPR